MTEKYAIECKTEDDSRQLFMILRDVAEGRATISTAIFDGLKIVVFVKEVF